MIDIREKLDAIGPVQMRGGHKGRDKAGSPCGNADNRRDKKIPPVWDGIVSGTDLWQAGEEYCGKGTSCVTS